MPSTMSLVRRRHSDMPRGMPNSHFGRDLRPLEDMSTPRMEATGVAKHLTSLERFPLLVFPASVILFSLFLLPSSDKTSSHTVTSVSVPHMRPFSKCGSVHLCIVAVTLQTSPDIVRNFQKSPDIPRHLHSFCFFCVSSHLSSRLIVLAIVCHMFISHRIGSSVG